MSRPLEIGAFVYLESPQAREDTHVQLAKQLYVDGRLSLDELERALDAILAGGSIHDVVQLGLPARPSYRLA